MSFLLTGNNLLYDHMSWVVHFLHIPRFQQIRFFLSFLFIKLSRYSLSNVRIIIPSLLYRLLNFRFNTSLKASESTRNQGKIIIDARIGLPHSALPTDIIERLYLSGKDHGCSDYENMMFLIPGGEYIQHIISDTPGYDVNIDKNDTITFQASSAKRSLAIKFPDYLNILDGTINNYNTPIFSNQCISQINFVTLHSQ